MTINMASRQRIRQRANFLCEYCHSSEEASTSRFTFDHLMWSKEKTKIIGQTAIGRATIERLDMNDDLHDEGLIVQARHLWIRGGWGILPMMIPNSEK